MRWMTRSALLTSLTAALTASACGGGGGGSSSLNSALSGAWQYSSGPLLHDPFPSLGNIGYLELATTGTGTLFVATPTNGIPGCEPVGFAVLNDTNVTIDFPDVSDASGSSLLLFRYSVSGDTLSLTDIAGAQTVFQRAAAVPASSGCNQASITQTLPIPVGKLPDFGYRPTLTSDATDLWFHTAAGGNASLNPALGSTGTTLTFPTGGQFQFVRATQGGDFWIDCECGHNTQMELRSAADAQLAAFDLSGAPISRDFDITAATYDGRFLWVAGRDLTRAVPGIIKLDTTVSPPNVLLAEDFDLTLDGMTFQGGSLWGSATNFGEQVVEMTTAGTLQASFVLPRDGRTYQGLTTVAGSVYALRGTLKNGGSGYAAGEAVKLGP